MQTRIERAKLRLYTMQDIDWYVVICFATIAAMFVVTMIGGINLG